MTSILVGATGMGAHVFSLNVYAEQQNAQDQDFKHRSHKTIVSEWSHKRDKATCGLVSLENRESFAVSFNCCLFLEVCVVTDSTYYLRVSKTKLINSSQYIQVHIV